MYKEVFFKTMGKSTNTVLEDCGEISFLLNIQIIRVGT